MCRRVRRLRRPFEVGRVRPGPPDLQASLWAINRNDKRHPSRLAVRDGPALPSAIAENPP